MEFSLTNRFLVVPLSDVKEPPTIILPSDCIAMSNTLTLNPVPKFVLKLVSSVPSEFSLTNRFLVFPLKDVKRPPTIILPSDCILTE